MECWGTFEVAEAVKASFSLGREAIPNLKFSMKKVETYHAFPMSLPTHREVVVVGSGFSGLCIGAKLKAAGIEDFLILEKASEIGGTWRDNDYPGAACDVPGRLYSFSFMQNGAWSKRFPQRDELYAYTLRCAAAFNLLQHVRLNTELLHGEYDEVNLQWTLQTSVGVITARSLVSSVGPLSRPLVPALPGKETFHGQVFHSSRWDHGCDLTGKRVAVIGTGASAVQFVPEIARVASTVHIFQRTAPWVVPRGDRNIALWKQKLLSWSPLARGIARGACFLDHEVRLLAFAKHPSLMSRMQKRVERHIRDQVPEELRQRVTPDYALGCKRILLSDDYYPALNRGNVELIPEPAARFVVNAIVTPSGCERHVDVGIFATGFETDSLVGPIELKGRGGRSLRHLARSGLEAYKGVTIHGFPNFFMLGGPNTGLGHSSMLLMIESAATYTVEALKAIRRRRLHAVDVRADVQQHYNDWLQEKLAGTVWNSGCKSWYLNSSSGKNHLIWPTFTFTYRLLTRKFDLSNYDIRAM